MIQIEDYFKIKGSIFMGTSDNLASLFRNLDDKGRWELKIFFILEFVRFASDQRGKNTKEIHSIHCSILWHNLRLVSELLVWNATLHYVQKLNCKKITKFLVPKQIPHLHITSYINDFFLCGALQIYSQFLKLPQVSWGNPQS